MVGERRGNKKGMGCVVKRRIKTIKMMQCGYDELCYESIVIVKMLSILHPGRRLKREGGFHLDESWSCSNT